MSESENPNQQAGGGSDASRISVAVIGTGMAGLVTAYLLQHDERQKFDIEVFESQEALSLDAEAENIESEDGKDAINISHPMRVIDDGYYKYMTLMYEHLGIKCDPQKFLFSYSYIPKAKPGSGSDQAHEEAAQAKVSFLYSSNNHRIPPLRPDGLSFFSWLGELFYVTFFFGWFVIACFWVNAGKAHPKPPAADQGQSESLEEYFHRVRLPRYFVHRYILPPLSSMSTCTHSEMLSFPASDIVHYIRRTYGAPHYLVRGGTRAVEHTLSKGLNIRLGARVTSVRPAGSSVMVCWEATSSASGLAGEKIPPMSCCQRTFDRVILAIPPNAVGAIFEPLREETSAIPTTSVESLIHTDASTLPNVFPASVKAQTASKENIEWAHLRSTAESTESIHEHPSSYIITTSPLIPIDPSKVVRRSYFTRTLRTPQSRAIVNRIFDKTSPSSDQESRAKPPGWRNGDGNVFLVGSWCWDGMVLLEGCVVSAMRLADEFGVRVPWVKR
ncbi:hypothetical protein McanMca71_004460 [Microsporum canis]|uniref:Amine oxidase domain-containing protein n=1 Tax=Arthroderma otae (strain ATCC MYA-4605 / CBS 113480) TaxID=554155 RepID=C5FPB3_ARTOC|nr:conserved hypothetical protein [Microsporum canis CBS 113480]EEQ31429.1 conserved hypothetical protein [Microsporum canis CBS 113480]